MFQTDGEKNVVCLDETLNELTAREACGILRGIVELHKWVGCAMGGGRFARVSI